MRDIEEYRALAATLPSDRLINLVYEKSGYPDLVQAMANGELRLANLRLLLEYAKKYEGSGFNGLSGFVRMLDRLEQQDADLASASTVGGAEVVQIMSIHRSKGLELSLIHIYNGEERTIGGVHFATFTSWPCGKRKNGTPAQSAQGNAGGTAAGFAGPRAGVLPK